MPFLVNSYIQGDDIFSGQFRTVYKIRLRTSFLGRFVFRYLDMKSSRLTLLKFSTGDEGKRYEGRKEANVDSL
jgi:hypothetical protein